LRDAFRRLIEAFSVQFGGMRLIVKLYSMMEGKVNTKLAAKQEGQAELVTFDDALSEMLPDHGFSPNEVNKLRQAWNRQARDWAQGQGTLPGHAQKIEHDQRWKTSLPREKAQDALRPAVAKAAQRRREQLAQQRELMMRQIEDMQQQEERYGEFLNQ
jgi:hypothetical protein